MEKPHLACVMSFVKLCKLPYVVQNASCILGHLKSWNFGWWGRCLSCQGWSRTTSALDQFSQQRLTIRHAFRPLSVHIGIGVFHIHPQGKQTRVAANEAGRGFFECCLCKGSSHATTTSSAHAGPSVLFRVPGSETGTFVKHPDSLSFHRH